MASVTTAPTNPRPADPKMADLIGKALVGLAEESQRYYYTYYYKSVGWKAAQTALTIVGGIGPLIVGGLIVLVPGWNLQVGISSMIVGLFSSLSNLSFINKFIKEYETAGDDYKTLGLTIQYDSVLAATKNAQPDVEFYLNQLKALIDKYEDPGGMSLEHFSWVNDHIEETSVAATRTNLLEEGLYEPH